MSSSPPVPSDPRVEAARRIARHLATLLDADLHLRLPDGEAVPLGSRPLPESSAGVGIAIRSADALTRLARRPTLTTAIELIAAGEVDIEGGTLLDLAERRGTTRTRGLLKRLDKGLLLRNAWPLLRGRTGGAEAGSGEAGSGAAFSGAVETRVDKGRDDGALVRFHYDLSNAFYALFLGPSMAYTCAYWERPDTTLDEAQAAKFEMICRKLRLQAGERLLDIGCGWGGLVRHAARTRGVRAHGVTLSEEQLAFARARIAAEGLSDLVTVELRDYRTLEAPEPYDKIASIGMFEHVGLDNHAAYFAQVHRLLRPRGLYLHHAIARPGKKSMRGFRRKRAEYAALTRYIFPGGELDTIGMSVSNLDAHGFEVHDVEAWREHYARTTRAWTLALQHNREAAAREVGEAKTRLWLLYLAGCCLAFERGSANIFQTLASKRAKGASGLPPTRADLYR